jgi:hypothetical protein
MCGTPLQLCNFLKALATASPSPVEHGIITPQARRDFILEFFASFLARITPHSGLPLQQILHLQSHKVTCKVCNKALSTTLAFTSR